MSLPEARSKADGFFDKYAALEADRKKVKDALKLLRGSCMVQLQVKSNRDSGPTYVIEMSKAEAKAKLKEQLGLIETEIAAGEKVAGRLVNTIP